MRAMTSREAGASAGGSNPSAQPESTAGASNRRSCKLGRRFGGSRRGSVAVIFAITMPVMIGFIGLTVEVGMWLLVKRAMQGAADAAAYSAAIAAAVGNVPYATEATSVAAQDGYTNGTNGVTVTVNSPPKYGNYTSNGGAIEVIIQQPQQLMLSAMLPGVTAPTISARATAIKPVGACIIALNPSGTGITVTSASGISAPHCAVASNSTVSVASASNITTIAVDYDSSSPPSATSAGTIAAPAGETLTITKGPVADPLAGTPEVVNATARLTTVEALTSPAAPSVPSGVTLSFSASSYSGSVPSGCTTPTHSGSSWTLTCTSGGTYDFGSLSVSSTATLAFNTGGSASTTYNFSGGITVSSSAGLTAGPGTFNIAQGIIVSSASSATFGAGTFDIGPSTSACTDGGKYSLCVESSTSLTLGGPSSFTFGGGIYAGSSATIKLGSGTTNTYDIGASSNGNAASAASSSNLLFADATSGTTSFEVNGNISAASAACLALPDAAEHDINGYISANSASNTTLGSGIYTVSDYIDDESASGGGGCSGWSGGTADTGVTLVLGALTTPSSGTCSGMAVCVLSASSQALVAPTSGPTAGLAIIGPTSSSNTAGALFESASSGSYSGVVYMPHGPITISSASGLGGGSSACLVLIGSQITVSSASATGSTCTSVPSALLGGQLVE